MSYWKITALDTGIIETDKSGITYLKGCGEIVNVPAIMFLIESKKKIVVDTSFESAEKTWKIHREKVQRSREQEIKSVFSKIGVDPKEIEIVIFTHLHYDHCGNNKIFENARFIVQEEELRYAMVPLPGSETAYFSPLIGVTPSYLGINLKIISGDKKICEGISVITTPGHTMGSQSVLVNTKKGICCITGDIVMSYENIEKSIPVGDHINLIDCFKSMSRVRDNSDYIIPSHDMKVLEKGEFF